MGRAWAVVVVASAHAALLWWVSGSLARSPTEVQPPAVLGMLVSPPPAEVKVEPRPIEPAPLPVQPVRKPRPKPVPKPVPQSKPTEPVPAGPPSERAVSEPPAVPSPPLAAAAPAAAPAPRAPEPVVPPHSDASHLSNPAPVYPRLSRRMAEEGRVFIDVYILPDGTVGEIRLKQSSGYPRLDQAALDAVRQWRYVPARRGGEPIPYWYVQPVVFSLSS